MISTLFSIKTWSRIIRNIKYIIIDDIVNVCMIAISVGVANPYLAISPITFIRDGVIDIVNNPIIIEKNSIIIVS